MPDACRIQPGMVMDLAVIAYVCACLALAFALTSALELGRAANRNTLDVAHLCCMYGGPMVTWPLARLHAATNWLQFVVLASPVTICVALFIIIAWLTRSLGWWHAKNITDPKTVAIGPFSQALQYYYYNTGLKGQEIAG